MSESIFDHNYSPEENAALGFVSDWDALGDYLSHRSDNHKTLDIAILYLYRLKLRTFQFYLSRVKDEGLLDDADEMIMKAFEHKFRNIH